MRYLLILAILILSVVPAMAQDFSCDEWGTLHYGIFCEIDEDKVNEYYNVFSTPEQLEILQASYPATYICRVKTPTRNNVLRSANFHIRAHENSPVLEERGLPHDTELIRLEFIHKPDGSEYNWVKVEYEGVVGYVTRHSVWCNRTDEVAPQ